VRIADAFTMPDHVRHLIGIPGNPTGPPPRSGPVPTHPRRPIAMSRTDRPPTRLESHHPSTSAQIPSVSATSKTPRSPTQPRGRP
jgi:hypothetical protein